MSGRAQPPLEVRRKLRREVHYGCPICGNPLLTYHHIKPWHEEHHYRPQDMIALCYNHAHEADTKAISPAKLYNLKANPPFHRRIRQRLTIDDWTCFTLRAANGSVVFENCFTVLRLQGNPVISFRNQGGAPALFVDLRDKDGHSLLLIEENDWLVDVGNIWDCEFKGNRLTVFDRSRFYYVKLRVDAEASQVWVDYRIHCFGQDFFASKEGFNIGPYVFEHFTFRNCSAAFDFSRDGNGCWKGRIACP